ncbi:arylsulfatase [Pandoraea sp.]|uniref:arylsulfatase n=1 Tax=Pandoraea sp. TaxID=1883445 RepID=UPI001220C588|nr:arylsulfatase [Pandoraea sp.]TAL53916.1 MAG: arylsulfatase [Pandoraea sp.]TAM17225.1 MAG: arylsulfatase [Pandoraea sp.]
MMERPNIVLIVADNLGWGELGCYGGGKMMRGAATPRIDALAASGMRLLNYNVESDCVPTRSALMTGRHPIRTGAFQSVPPGLPQGLKQDEWTLAQMLSEAGYATAHFGKWHLGDVPGRYPSDRGFDEWYGIPRTTDETQFTTSVGFDPSVVELPYIMTGKKGEPSHNVKIYDLATRRTIDEELVVHSRRFMRQHASTNTPFFLYLPMVHLHFPTLPHADFDGKTGLGEFADSLAEMDFRVGQIVDELSALGIAENTLLIFCSDNGPEYRAPYRGTAGPWTGTYHTAMEGSLRVPFIAHWPRRIPAGNVNNEIVHVVDLLPTLGELAGARLPQEKPIDGVSQLNFLLGQQAKSNREGFLFYIKEELRAIKWRDWKLHLVWEPAVNCGARKLEVPYLFHLIQDPKEETDILTRNTWVLGPMLKLVRTFKESVKIHPNTPPGEPD